jgi:lysophospholipase L1-like esterase
VPTPTPTPTPTPPSASPAISYFGRFDKSDPAGPRFTWSNTAIVAQFSGQSLSVTLNNSADQLYFSYLIDGGPVMRMSTSSGTKTYSLASGLPSGNHKIEFYRDSEGNTGVTQFLGFNFAGGQLQPPPAYSSNVRLEVIGDSNACGYGDLGTDPCTFSTATESAYKSYPEQAVALLGARPATNICYSGIGVYQNWGYNGPNSGFPSMPTYYLRTLTDSSPQYQFATDPSAQPNVVVIQLGGNDFWDGNGPSQTNFVNAYTGLVKTVRSKYPNAYIIAASSPMNSSAKNFIQIAVGQLQSSGESKIQFLDLYDSTAFTVMGCNGHPSLTTQQHVAITLANAIKALRL